MTREYKPLQDIMITLNRILYRRGVSLREITRSVEKKGLNLNNVVAVANGKPEQLSSIVKFDKYISEILAVTGYDEYDLLRATIDGLVDPKSKTFQDDLSTELRNFLRNPESEKYIQYAYKRYMLDKLEDERNKIKEELNNL